MNPICLFEAGGTKTTLLVDRNGSTETFHLPGFNPNRYSQDFEVALQKVTFPENAEYIFYGSGLGSVQNRAVISKILLKKTQTQPLVFDDQLGAARAAYGSDAGLLGIMGTGAFAAWYNGSEILDRKGGHGYLIDDIGGGFELGKLLLSKWLNNDLPQDADQAISALLKTPKADFTTSFYANINLDLIATVPKTLENCTQQADIKVLLTDYFDLYFKRHVTPILLKHNTESMTLIGSIAVNFEKFIGLAAEKYGIKRLDVIGNPSVKLLDYHRRKGFKS